MKFQLKMGQTESLNKIRGLRRDVARIHTVIREKQLGIEYHKAAAATAPVEGAETATPKKKVAKPAARAKAKAKAKTKTKAKTRKK
jgi:large subunit ribosomal protein L29